MGTNGPLVWWVVRLRIRFPKKRLIHCHLARGQASVSPSASAVGDFSGTEESVAAMTWPGTALVDDIGVVTLEERQNGILVGRSVDRYQGAKFLNESDVASR